MSRPYLKGHIRGKSMQDKMKKAKKEESCGPLESSQGL